jgi:hypothetical protein
VRRRRGTGSDARADPNDGYRFEDGFSFCEIRRMCGRVKNTFIWKVVNFIDARATGIPKACRNAKRRLPVAYHWLDTNAHLISDELFRAAIIFASSGVR